MDISKVTSRNRRAWNNTHDPVLAYKLLTEEVWETYVAWMEGDRVEIVDWLIDTIVVALGELHKLWLTDKEIIACYDEVCRSNESKFVNGKCLKNSDGKITKWPDYSPPNLFTILS